MKDMNLSSPKIISKSELRLIAGMRGIKVKKKTHKKDDIFKALCKKTHNKSPFKSILSKNECEKVKKTA